MNFFGRVIPDVSCDSQIYRGLLTNFSSKSDFPEFSVFHPFTILPPTPTVAIEKKGTLVFLLSLE
jgi:hypothetical protein